MSQEKKCNSCKKDGLTAKELGMIAFGFSILGFAIYGIVHFIKHTF